MTMLATNLGRSAGRRSTSAPSFRHLIIRSNHFLASRLPASWIFWFAFPHEVWHFLAARALGLRARIVPGVTLFAPAARGRTAIVLLSPAVLGLLCPVIWHLAVQAVSGNPALVNWPMLALSMAGWWSGCLGDFIDVWLLIRRRESDAERQLRTQQILARLDAALTHDWRGSAPSRAAGEIG